MSKPFKTFLIALPITGLSVVFVPRVIVFVLAYVKKNDLSPRKLHSTIRSITSVLMFGLSMSMAIVLIVLYKGDSNLMKMSEIDITFIRSDRMKWGIILIAIILILGTMIDLYFSLVLRTFYLTFMTYPDILDGIEGKSDLTAA